jgi:hypothetical protein
LAPLILLSANPRLALHPRHRRHPNHPPLGKYLNPRLRQFNLKPGWLHLKLPESAVSEDLAVAAGAAVW